MGRRPPLPPAPSSPYPLQIEAQDRFIAQGKKLCNEEKAKREKDPFSMWDEMGANASAGVYPKGTDVLLYKFSGLFYVAPAQDSFMSRLRIPGGVMPSWQFRGVADLARRFGAGHSDVTTRANLQIREIQAAGRTGITSSAWPITGSSAEGRGPTTSATAPPRRPAGSTRWS